MLYTDLTKKAMKIAFEAHKDQVDKSGLPYVYHPFHLAEQMDNELAVCAALLHDVVEDTNMTIEQLGEHGFPKEVLMALKCLTHDDNEPYFDYVRNIKGNSIATQVKIADLRHNMDLSRLEIIDDAAINRREKYLKALAILESDKTAVF